METASPQVFIPITHPEIEDYFSKNNNERKDTNIGFITFNFLKEENLESSLSLGDPIYCQTCGASINIYSNVRKNPHDENSTWICAFCNNENHLLEFNEKEKPIINDPLYLIENFNYYKKEIMQAKEIIPSFLYFFYHLFI